MDNFSKILLEARKKYDSESLLSSEVQRFLTKVNKVIPATVKDVIYLTQKYNLMDRESIEEIRKSSKSSLSKLAKKYGIAEEDIENLYKQLGLNLIYQHIDQRFYKSMAYTLWLQLYVLVMFQGQ